MAGCGVKLPVADNHFVHKGDELFEIDPAAYRIALESAQAQAQRDAAALEYARDALETDWLVGAGGFEPLHFKSNPLVSGILCFRCGTTTFN